MPSIPLHVRSRTPLTNAENPLPQLLQTPSGLALLELQGTIHFPGSTDDTSSLPTNPNSTPSTEVGKLVFPLHNPQLKGEDDTSWMKRVYFYAGKHQRMTGEVKKLGKPFAVVRKKPREDTSDDDGERMEGVDGAGGEEEELEIVDVVRYKIIFASRPEPVGGESESQV